MKVFELIRKHDVSGVSGVGKVLQGIIFDTGVCVVNWLKPDQSGSVNVFFSFDQFKKIHVDSHPENESDIIFFTLSRPHTGDVEFDVNWLMKVIRLQRGDKIVVKMTDKTAIQGTVVKMDWKDGLHEIMVNGQLILVKTKDILIKVEE